MSVFPGKHPVCPARAPTSEGKVSPGHPSPAWPFAEMDLPQGQEQSFFTWPTSHKGLSHAAVPSSRQISAHFVLCGQPRRHHQGYGRLEAAGMPPDKAGIEAGLEALPPPSRFLGGQFSGLPGSAQHTALACFPAGCCLAAPGGVGGDARSSGKAERPCGGSVSKHR